MTAGLIQQEQRGHGREGEDKLHVQCLPGPDTWVLVFSFLPYVCWQGKIQLMENQRECLAMGFQKIQILIEIKRAVGHHLIKREGSGQGLCVGHIPLNFQPEGLRYLEAGGWCCPSQGSPPFLGRLQSPELQSLWADPISQWVQCLRAMLGPG